MLGKKSTGLFKPGQVKSSHIKNRTSQVKLGQVKSNMESQNKLRQVNSKKYRSIQVRTGQVN